MGHRFVFALVVGLCLSGLSAEGALPRSCKWMASLLIGVAGTGGYFLLPSNSSDLAENYHAPAPVARERYSAFVEELFDAEGKAKISLRSDFADDPIPTLTWFAGNDLLADRIKASLAGKIAGVESDERWRQSGVPLRLKALLLKTEDGDRVRVGMETNFLTLYSEKTEKLGVLFSGEPFLVQINHSLVHEGRTVKMKGEALVVFREEEARFEFLKLEATLTVPMGIEISSKGTVSQFSSVPIME